ncbi:MAG: hypothetical protein IT293_06910 [Deltaproteobacteria bacterium]|nr:hypothetical protein [Deltaproteobacteria bacterium]
MNPATIEPTPTTDPTNDALRARVLDFIARPSHDDFDGLALEIHHYQYRVNPVYRRFADRLGAAAPGAWREIPAVPAEAFRMSVLACGPAERVYRSSGTTAGPGRRAAHHVPDVDVYRASALAGFARAVLPSGTRRRFVVAAPERASHPASSLGEMVTWLRQSSDTDSVPSCLTAGGVDVERLAHTLDRVGTGGPIVLIAVTSALLRLADWAEARRRRFTLPAGSLVVDTGGCKGYAQDLARADVLARYRRILDVATEQIVNEYGMTELASQLYATGDGPLRAPPWLRVLVCDLASGREVAPGAVGCLRFFDLANLGSVLAIQTEDVGRVRDGGIELLGRAPGAVARGCSLLADEGAA